jgi:hypothetical protein
VPRIRNCTKNLRVSVDHRSVADVLARRSCRYRNPRLDSLRTGAITIGDNAYSFVLSPEPYAADPINHRSQLLRAPRSHGPV